MINQEYTHLAVADLQESAALPQTSPSSSEEPPFPVRKRPSEEEARRIAEIGREIYETRLRSELEAQYGGQFLAIATDTGEYAVGDSALAAALQIINKRPDAPLYSVRIGFSVLGKV